jgi:hypothetical protein
MKDVAKDVRRGNEHSAAIATVGRMADTVGRSLGEEHSMINVGGQTSSAEMLGKRAVAQQHDVVSLVVFLGCGSATAGATMIIAHTDQGAAVEHSERKGIIE